MTIGNYRIKLKAENGFYAAWHLLPTIRFGKYTSTPGFFLALTFLKFDACLRVSRAA